ncbi:COP9 signalosome complex subunit 8 [Glycine soja]
MDFSSVRAALDSKSYDKVADVCDNLMLQVAADGIAYQDDWPYAIHLLSHIYVHNIIYVGTEINKIPVSLPQSKRASLKSLRFGKLVRSSELYAKEMFQLLLSAYSMISIKDTALFLGMNEDDATNYVLQQGWTVDPTSRMLIVKKQPAVTQQKLDPSKLQRLTECLPS